MNQIKNIVFDLGGVVIDLDRDKAVEALTELGIKDADSLLGVYAQKGLFFQLETGEVTAAQFYDALLPQCKPGTTNEDIQNALEKFLIKIPVERLKLIRQLKEKGYRLFVLSNTNPIMFNHWIDNAFRVENLTINDYFDNIVVSFQERVCKPDKTIFENLLKRYRLDPDETLFLDDSEANCKAANEKGVKTCRVLPHGESSFEEICGQLL